MTHFMKAKRLVSSALLCGTLAACVTAAPLPEPVLAYAGQTSCSSAMSTALAADLTPKSPAGVSVKTAPVTAVTPCVTGAGAGQAYVVFALPSQGLVASVNAGAVIEAKRVLAPAVMTLDASGAVKRTFAGDDLARRGRTLSALFTPQPDERFVAVAVDPAAIGGRLSFVSVDPDAAPTPEHLTPRLTPEVYRAGLGAAYSYEGEAFARVYFSDPNPPKPAYVRPKTATRIRK